jgi:hypothetical protein
MSAMPLGHFDQCVGRLPWIDHGQRVSVRCDQPVIPMTRYCAEHLIAHAAPPKGPVAVGSPPEPAATGATPK